MINKKRLIKLTQDLIRIDSQNPPGNEAAIASFVAGYLRQIGLKPKKFCFFSHRDNVLAVLKGRSSLKPLLLTPHLDTVPAGTGWSVGPFSGKLLGGKIYGRGASDCKGNLAVALEVFSSLIESKAFVSRDVIFLATADEETGSKKGLIPILKKKIVKPAFAVVLDASDFGIITAQKGLIHFRVKVAGRKAHGAYPHLGRNAINGAVRLIESLENLKFGKRAHKLLGFPTVNIGTIHGGDKVNMVADWCEFEVDLRFLPNVKAQAMLNLVKRAFNKQKIHYTIDVDNEQAPYEVDARHVLVTGLKKAARDFSVRSNVAGSYGATVLTFFKSLGITAVATGYGLSRCMHASDEYVNVNDLFNGALVLERFIKDFETPMTGHLKIVE